MFSRAHLGTGRIFRCPKISLSVHTERFSNIRFVRSRFIYQDLELRTSRNHDWLSQLPNMIFLPRPAQVFWQRIATFPNFREHMARSARSGAVSRPPGRRRTRKLNGVADNWRESGQPFPELGGAENKRLRSRDLRRRDGSQSFGPAGGRSVWLVRSDVLDLDEKLVCCK